MGSSEVKDHVFPPIPLSCVSAFLFVLCLAGPAVANEPEANLFEELINRAGLPARLALLLNPGQGAQPSTPEQFFHRLRLLAGEGSSVGPSVVLIGPDKQVFEVNGGLLSRALAPGTSGRA